MLIPLFIIIIVLSVAYLFFRPKKAGAEKQFFISTQGQNAQRLNKLDLDNGAENVSSILDSNRLDFPRLVTDYEAEEYKADPESDFVITLATKSGQLFKREDLWNLFDYSWRNEYDSSEIFGYSPEESRWTYVIAGGSPETYSTIQLAIGVLGVYNDEIPDYNPAKLEMYITELNKRIAQYPEELILQLTESVTNAIGKAKQLIELQHEFNRDMILVLKSGRMFNGRKAWDVLTGLGLKWGDGDLFHWNNGGFDYGHDQFFSVWTSTAPGYFLPEDIQQEKFSPTDLVFGYSIPRSADPKNVFEIMLEAALYCKEKLGGEIVDARNIPFNTEKERKELAVFVEEMERRGIPPGSGKALRMY